MVGLLCSSIAVKNSFGCMVGAVPVRGTVSAYNTNVQIMQPQVVQQIGASCGYHALLNAKILDAMLFKAGENQFLNEQIRNVTFGDAGAAWKAFAITQDTKYASGDWLEAEVVDKLVQKYFPEIGKNFVILDENQVFFDAEHAHCGVGEEERHLFWATLKSQLQPGFFFVFFLNNQTVSMRTLGNAGGHWIALCLYVDSTGRHIYYVMDSLNKYRCDEQAVMNVINSIETDRIFIPRDTVEMVINDTRVFVEEDEDEESSLLAQKISDGFNRAKSYIMTYLGYETKKDNNNPMMLPTGSDKEGGKRGLGILQQLKKTAPVQSNSANVQNDGAIAQALQKDEEEEDPELVAAYENSLVSLRADKEDDSDLQAALQLSLTTNESDQKESIQEASVEDTSFMGRLKKNLRKTYNQFE